MADFTEGLFVKRNDKAPDWVICSLAIKVETFVAWLNDQSNDAGYVNIQVKRAKSGKLYAELDTWKPDRESNAATQNATHDTGEEVPF